MLIIGPSRSGKTNALLNLIQKDNDNFIDKIYLYAKDLDEPKYQFLTEKREDAGIKRPDVIVNLVEKILVFNEQADTFYTSEESPRNIMPELENEESAAQRRNQRGEGLKTLTPKQMLSRLPLSLAQLKGGNNSQKLKNKIRQLLYSLYRSKKLSQTIYKNLMNVIEKWKQYL